MSSDLIPGPLDRLEIIDRSLGREAATSDHESSEKESRTTRSPSDGPFSRKKVYKMIESKLQ